jgi:hypothetical protein
LFYENLKPWRNILQRCNFFVVAFNILHVLSKIRNKTWKLISKFFSTLYGLGLIT